MTRSKFPVIEHRLPARSVPVAADTLIPFGNLVATNGDGNAVLAADATGLSIVGVAWGQPTGLPTAAGQIVDNRKQRAGARSVRVRTGFFRFQNSSAAPVTTAELGKEVFVVNETTVAKTTKASILAGIAVGLEGTAYVWLIVGPIGTLPGAPSLGSQ